MPIAIEFVPTRRKKIAVDVVESRYFWIIGDDDRPMTGSVTKIVKFLINESPDLLYISSKWSEIIHRPSAQEFSGELAFKRLSRDRYAEKVNVWVTYISGTIINIERLYELNKIINIRRFSNSFLVQLGWVLPMLMLGNRFYFIKQECIFAKSGNSGGYKLLSVFGENFPKVLKTVCGSDSRVYKIIFNSLVWNFMPTLIWANRSERATEFIKENPLPVIRGLRKSMGYWFLLMPLAAFPKFSAFIVWAIYRVYKKVAGLK